jgi:hypothetical protein
LDAADSIEQGEYSLSKTIVALHLSLEYTIPVFLSSITLTYFPEWVVVNQEAKSLKEPMGFQHVIGLYLNFPFVARSVNVKRR